MSDRVFKHIDTLVSELVELQRNLVAIPALDRSTAAPARRTRPTG